VVSTILISGFFGGQPRNFENVTLVARRRKNFRWFSAIFFVPDLPQKKRCFKTQEFTRVFSTGVVIAYDSNRKIAAILTHSSHSYHWVHAHWGWQSSYEIVGDCSDKGGHQCPPLDRFILREVLARRRMMFMLRVMKCVVSYNLFWNWIGVVRFQVVSHEVCSDKGFVIWHPLSFFFTNCVVVITEYSNSNHFQYQWIGKKSKTLKSNAQQKKICKKHVSQARFFCEKNAPQAKSM